VKDFHLDFGIYAIELKRIISFLKQDISDDWFQDPLLFEDKFNEDAICEYFEANIRTNNGVYTPTARLLLNIPKKHGTLRYSLETNFFDRIAYHAFGVTLIRHVDKLIPNRVFSHRFNSSEFSKAKPRYLFYNSINQWKKFDEYTKIDSGSSAILITDLQNYYEHIDISILQEALYGLLKKVDETGKNKSIIRFCIDSLCACLEQWSFSWNTGVPQNRDISSFLANVYMLPVDNHMIDRGYDYYRYMDDIRIVCKDNFEARKALKEISHELRKYGLTINGYKTEILIPGTEAHTNFIDDDNIELERIDSMLRTRKKQIVAIAYSDVKVGLENCLAQDDFDSRQFRFYLYRMAKIALCKGIDKPDGYFDVIRKKIFSALVNYPTSTDSFYNLLVGLELSKQEIGKIYRYLTDPEKAIYSWQNYLLWKLLIHHNYQNRRLLSYAKRTVLNGIKVAEICGSLLYIGRFGSEKDKRHLIHNFKEGMDFMVQRHYMIALQEMSYSEVKNLSSKVSVENKGTYRCLHEHKDHRYMTSPRTIQFGEIFNQVGFYA
jgi:hypothetical protein